MTGTPVLLVDNVMSEIQYPLHVVSGHVEPSGNEAWRVADGRRSPADRWLATSTATAAWVKVTCNRTRGCDMIVLDRGHNLAGKTVALECSDDDFTTFESIFEITLPSASGPGDIDDTLGVETEEGAWVKRFTTRAATHWRFYVTAQAGVQPSVVGLWVGKSYSSRVFNFPWSDGAVEPIASIAVSESGWEGAGATSTRRTGQIDLRMKSHLDADLARLWVQGHFMKRRPMWICADQEQADRTVLTVPAGPIQVFNDGVWPFMQTQIMWVEHEALRSAS